MSKCATFGHPVMDIETGLCTECGEPIDCPPVLDFGVPEEPSPSLKRIFGCIQSEEDFQRKRTR